MYTPLHDEIFICLGVEAITDLYVTLPEDVTAVPQNYTVDCLVSKACDYAAVSSHFDCYMFMEGSHAPSEQAVQYCNNETSLSCFEELLDSNDSTTIDNQLTVTWNANKVITQGDYNSYHTTSTAANGDHDVLCVARCTIMGASTGQIKSEEAFVSIRGMHTHACKCQKFNALYN